MATTLVLYEEILTLEENKHIFTTSSGEKFCVSHFEDGIARVYLTNNFHSRESFFETIAGCFHEDSNFKSELFKAFNCNENTTFKGILFKIDNVTILVKKDNANFNDINKEYWAGIKAIKEREQLEREAYMRTPEYRDKRIRELKALIHKQRIMNEIYDVNKTTEIEFKDDYARLKFEWWAKRFVACGKFAKYWAKYMQHLMKKHNKNLSEIAFNAYLLCNGERIDPYDYVANIIPELSQCWKYGDELKEWHIVHSKSELLYELIDSILSAK